MKELKKLHDLLVVERGMDASCRTARLSPTGDICVCEEPVLIDNVDSLIQALGGRLRGICRQQGVSAREAQY